MKNPTDTTINRIKKAMSEVQSSHSNEFYGWKISTTVSQSLQSLMLGDKSLGLTSYQDREVQESAYQIDIFTRHSSPRKMGNFHFTIDPMGILEEQIENGFQNALLVNNECWDLAEPGDEFDEVLTCDPLILEDIHKSHQQLTQEIQAKTKQAEGVNINSAELFTSQIITSIETSTGIKGTNEKSDIYFEIALEKLPLPNRQETLKFKNSMSLEDAKLSDFIESVIKDTLEIQDTDLPLTNESATILIDHEPLSNLFHNLASQLDAKGEYLKQPFLAVGDIIVEGEVAEESDPILLTLDPTIPAMVRSAAFTPEGLKTKRAEIIRDNRVVAQTVGNRIGQYLDREPNGIAGNLILQEGSKTKEELLQSVEECIEIISFSSLLVNSRTLAWSSEIKLGKHYKNGVLQGMVKGGVVSGEIKKNLANCQFSNETTKYNEVSSFGSDIGYIGPHHMLIKNSVKIAGA